MRRTTLAAATAALLTGPAWAQETPAGFYHITPGGIGAGYSDYFALFEDGTWQFGDQYECGEDGAPNDETVMQRRGQWSADGNRLVLVQADRTVIRGGTCACDAIACTLKGGTEATEETDREIVVDLGAACVSQYDPVAMIGTALPCLTIEGTGYFRLGPAEELAP